MDNDRIKRPTSTPISDTVIRLNEQIKRENQFIENGIVGESARAEGYIPRARVRKPRLDKTESAKINSVYFEEVLANIKEILSNKTVVFAVAGALALGGAGIGVSMAKYDAYQKNTEIVATCEIPDSNAVVEIQGNGEAWVVLEDGTKASTFNGISAEELARLSGYEGELASREASYEQISEGRSK